MAESEQQPEKKGRAVFVFDIPPELAKEIGVREVGVVELEVDEWKMAAKRAGGDPLQLAVELPLQGFRWCDGPVNLGNASADIAWAKLGPKGRDLVIAAYGSVNGAGAEATKAFLKSRRVVVG